MDRDARLARLAAARTRIAGVLSAAVVAVYFGFILLIAYAKPLLATRLRPGLSLGILLGALVIVVSWLSTFVYVRTFPIGDKKAGVEIFSYVVVDVEVTERLMRYLLTYNLKLILGGFGLAIGENSKASGL